jgi:hypothetical protein
LAPAVHRDAWLRFPICDDAGAVVGELVWKDGGTSLNAHCLCQDHIDASPTAKCHFDKTLTLGRKRGQGRPVGLLVAWLRSGCADYEEHRDVKSTLGQAASLELRTDARDWLKTVPGSHVIFQLEHLARDLLHAGDASEPEVIT